MGQSQSSNALLSSLSSYNYNPNKSSTSFGVNSLLPVAENFRLSQQITQGNLNSIRQLVEGEGASVEEESKYGCRPLMIAAELGHVHIAEYLIEMKADVNRSNSDSNTAATMATYFGKVDVLKTLVAHNADVNIKNAKGFSCLNLAALLGSVDAVNILLQNGANVESRDYDGLSSLHYVSQRGLLEIAQLLLNAKADINCRDKSGLTPLMCAALGCEEEMIGMLLHAGARVTDTSNAGFTAKNLAAIHGNQTIIQILDEAETGVNSQNGISHESNSSPVDVASVVSPKSKEISILQQELQRSREIHHELKEQLMAATRTMEEMNGQEQDVQRLEQEERIARLQVEKHEAAQQAAVLSAAVMESKEATDMLLSQLQSERTTRARLQDHIQQLQNQNTALLQDLRTMEDSFMASASQQSNEIQAMNQSMYSMQQQHDMMVENMHQENAALLEQNQIYEQQIHDLMGELQMWKDSGNDRVHEKEEMDAEMDRWMTEQQEHKETIQALNGQLLQLTDALERSKTEMTQMQNTIIDLNHLLNIAKMENEQLRSMLEKEKFKSRKSEDKAKENVNGELKSLADKLAASERKCIELGERLAAAEGQSRVSGLDSNNVKEMSIHQLWQHLAQTREELDAALEEKRRESAMSLKHAQQLAHLEKQLDERNKDLNEKERQLRELQLIVERKNLQMEAEYDGWFQRRSERGTTPAPLIYQSRPRGDMETPMTSLTASTSSLVSSSYNRTSPTRSATKRLSAFDIRVRDYHTREAIEKAKERKRQSSPPKDVKNHKNQEDANLIEQADTIPLLLSSYSQLSSSARSLYTTNRSATAGGRSISPLQTYSSPNASEKRPAVMTTSLTSFTSSLSSHPSSDHGFSQPFPTPRLRNVGEIASGAHGDVYLLL